MDCFAPNGPNLHLILWNILPRIFCSAPNLHLHLSLFQVRPPGALVVISASDTSLWICSGCWTQADSMRCAMFCLLCCESLLTNYVKSCNSNLVYRCKSLATHAFQTSAKFYLLQNAASLQAITHCVFSSASGPVPAALKLFRLDLSCCPTLAALRTIRSAAANATPPSPALATIISPRGLCAAAAASVAASCCSDGHGHPSHHQISGAAASAAAAACGRVISGLRPQRAEGKVDVNLFLKEHIYLGILISWPASYVVIGTILYSSCQSGTYWCVLLCFHMKG